MIDEFGVVWQHRDLLLDGFFTTVLISILAGFASLILGALLSTALMSHRALVAATATSLVDAMRCVPFLLFAYLIYYGLPSLGLRFNNWSSGLAALVIYHTAYMAELLRGAWRELPVETIEAGRAYGFHGLGLFRRVILPPVVFTALPTLGNQVIQIIKDSAFLTIIAVTELTHAATAIQAQYFVPFASFIVAVVLYWIMCLAVEGLVGVVGARAQAWR
jgi:polar amino acid transport system permease protein